MHRYVALNIILDLFDVLRAYNIAGSEQYYR